ncbi:hypothetical protein FOA52_008417 [Chlamydomonas sp. UWO 241]|nr:hypothetical protein FOA52_008417 [Chlamydomonas sp. UWO 241]
MRWGLDADTLAELPSHHPWELDEYMQHRVRTSIGGQRRLAGAFDDLTPDVYELGDPVLFDTEAARDEVGRASAAGQGRRMAHAFENIATDRHNLDTISIQLLDPGKDAVPNAASSRTDGDKGADSNAAASRTDGAEGKGPVGDKVCALFKSSGCSDFWRQARVPSKSAPRGTTPCPNNCSNGVGQCQYDQGYCMCPAGYKGADCSEMQKRPCTNHFRGRADPPGIPMGHIDPVTKEDLNWMHDGWKASRCAGVCDDNIGMCYCGQNSTHRRIPAPPDAPIGTPVVAEGRPMSDPCKPATMPDGKTSLHWGAVPFDNLYGPKGWCNAEPGTNPAHTCGCSLETLTGRDCEKPSQAFCMNQCSGRGWCDEGFCRCDDGWYGTDCSRRRGGMEIDPIAELPVWLSPVVKVPPASLPPLVEEQAEGAGRGEGGRVVGRRRPLMYVYDMPPHLNTQMLQYKLTPGACNHRIFGNGRNDTMFVSSGYNIEQYLHEVLLQSKHRTFDPDEADFFYVPVYITCMMWPVLGWADHPFFYAPVHDIRPMHAMNMILEAKRWLQKTFPWWDRRQGRDHIWLMNHDEGACYMPSE